MKKTLIVAGVFVAAVLALPYMVQAKVDVMAVYYPQGREAFLLGL